jgi:hypothetical protein
LYHHITNCFWYIDDEQNCLFFYSIFFNIAFFAVPIIPSTITTSTTTTSGRIITEEDLTTGRTIEDSTISYTKIKPPRNLSIPVTTHVRTTQKKFVSSHSKLSLAITDITSSTTENTLFTQKNQIQHVVQ